MSQEARIRELVEEVLDSERTPEEVCREHPELLRAVRERCRRFHGVAAELDALFPRSDALALPPAGLPHIPGHEVLAVLGHGGMGVVYKARHLRLKRIVAVKMLLAGPHATPQELSRFRLEAEAVAGLSHPNVVQVHDVGELEGRPFFTMEHVEGGSLAQRLGGRPLPASEAAALVATLASAVRAAHASGIVHRDLKPANVLLTASGTPKVTDFGLARRLRAASTLTASGARLGTPSYMAPEQVRGSSDAIGPAADVWALGAILYETLTGRPPFLGGSPLATQMQVLSEEPLPPSRRNAAVPRDLETICLTCLRKEPERRYASAEALEEDLQRFQCGEPIAARRTGPLERAAKWVRRRPAHATAGAAGALALLALGGAGGWVGWRNARIARAASTELDQALALERAGRWSEARTALERASGSLAHGAPAALRERHAALGRELDLVLALADIREARASIADFREAAAASDRAYGEAFEASGLARVGEPPAAAAARLDASAARQALLPALDDWASHVPDPERRAWVLAVVRALDPDPWRDRVRDPATLFDRDALEELARTAPLAEQPVELLVALGERLETVGGDGVAFLRRVQREHPGDFWANVSTGWALDLHHDPQAVEFYRSALAIRPRSAAVLTNLGAIFLWHYQLDEALETFGRLLAIDPRNAAGHGNMATALVRRARYDEAIEHCRAALAIEPDNAFVFGTLGNALWLSGRLQEALEASVRCRDLLPPSHPQHAQAGTQVELCELSLRTEALLDGVLEGGPLPEGSVALDFAEICYVKGRWTDAATLYARGFAETPRPFDDLTSAVRLEAAVCAAQAGLATEPDAPDALERAAWREQARAWLCEELLAWSEPVDGGRVVDATRLRERWWRAQRDPRLAGVRDAEALERLPPEEAEQCRALWGEVASLLARAPAR